MPLPWIVASNPDDKELQQWAFEHWQDHLEIQQAILKQSGINLEIQVIYPLNFDDPDEWLENHQLMHNEMNGLLKLNGSDLSKVDFTNDNQRNVWIWLNGQEHRAVRQALAI